MNITSFDLDLAIIKFVERRTENHGKQIDNSKSYAGSPMYYYCRHCGLHTETLPETHSQRPNTICVACDVLEKQGAMPDAKKAYDVAKQLEQAVIHPAAPS